VCHPGAKAKFVAGREHAFGMTGPVVYASGKKMVDWAARSDFLAGQRLSALGISEGEVLRQRILHLVKLFYKLLIPSIVGFMFLHQLLDYIRTKKNHRRSR
jgi:hypothetical protein